MYFRNSYQRLNSAQSCANLNNPSGKIIVNRKTDKTKQSDGSNPIRSNQAITTEEQNLRSSVAGCGGITSMGELYNNFFSGDHKKSTDGAFSKREKGYQIKDFQGSLVNSESSRINPIGTFKLQPGNSNDQRCQNQVIWPIFSSQTKDSKNIGTFDLTGSSAARSSHQSARHRPKTGAADSLFSFSRGGHYSRNKITPTETTINSSDGNSKTNGAGSLLSKTTGSDAGFCDTKMIETEMIGSDSKTRTSVKQFSPRNACQFSGDFTDAEVMAEIAYRAQELLQLMHGYSGVLREPNNSQQVQVLHAVLQEQLNILTSTNSEILSETAQKSKFADTKNDNSRETKTASPQSTSTYRIDAVKTASSMYDDPEHLVEGLCTDRIGLPSMFGSKNQFIGEFAFSSSGGDQWGQYPVAISQNTLQRRVYGSEKLEGVPKYAGHLVVLENYDWRAEQKRLAQMIADGQLATHTDVSLGGTNSPETSSQIQENALHHILMFRKPSSIKGNISTVINGAPIPEDVGQGSLGNCYLMSTIAAIAAKPERITRLLLQSQTSPDGLYCIALCLDGCWTPIILDDKLPATESGSLYFAKQLNDTMWPALIEKAYAKAYKTYYNIGRGGLLVEALRDLTGAPTKDWLLDPNQNLDRLWEKMSDGYQKTFIMTAGSNPESNDREQLGIVGGHGYSILELIKLSNGQRLIKMRNPWGHTEWQGDWSNHSDLWTPKLRKEAGVFNSAGFEDHHEGTFHMPLELFVEYFHHAAIAYYDDKSVYSYLAVENPTASTVKFQMTINEKGSYYIGLSQPRNRNLVYSHMSLVVAERVRSGGLRYVCSMANSERDPWCKATLPAGDYIILVYGDWLHSQSQAGKSQTTPNKFTLWTYGNETTMLSQIISPQPKECTILEQIFTQLLAFHQSESTFESAEKDWKYRFEDVNGYGCCWFENNTENVLEITVSNILKSCSFVKPSQTKNRSKFRLQIGPKKTDQLIWRYTDVDNNMPLEIEYQWIPSD